jgi:hypothetical protein
MDADEETEVVHTLAEDVDFPDDETGEDVVARVVDHIADLEWLLYLDRAGLDDQDLAAMADDAIDAGWQLILIYTELYNAEARGRVLQQMQLISDTCPNRKRQRRVRAIFGALAAHPGQRE